MKRLNEHLNLSSSDKLPGCVAVRATEKLTDGHVIGIDLSSGMLQHRVFNRRRRKALMFPFFTFHYSFFIVTSWWDVVWNAGWRSLLNQMSEAEQKDFEKEHLKEISEVIGDDGVWFNTEVLIAVGIK